MPNVLHPVLTMQFFFIIIQQITASEFGAIVRCVLEASTYLYCHRVYETWISIELSQAP